MHGFRRFKDRGRDEELRELLARRILMLDGGMGTVLQSADLGCADFGGARYEGCNEHLALTRPDAIAQVHADYFDAGADIVETDTFGAVRHVLAEYGLEHKVAEINIAAARLAVREAARFSSKDRPRFVAGSLGPGTKTILVTGGITFDEVRRAHAEQARALLEGGCDLLLLETQQDTLNVKASLLGMQDAFERSGRSIPVMLSVSVETMGTLLGGQTIEALYASVEHFPLLALGLNCATGPDFMTDHLRALASISRFPVLVYPNAGLPDEHGRYGESPATFAAKMARFASEGWLNLAGGCCGTTPAHIRAAAEALRTLPPRRPVLERRSLLSGMEPLVLEDDRRPALVGERTNVIGSRIFKDLIAREGFEEASEVARRQVRGGAHIVDLCLANPDRDEKADMERFLPFLVRKVKVPWMIDSTDPAVLEAALRLCPGKAVINSVNLEDGEERLKAVVPLARRYGAALVVGAIDEDKTAGMALTRERKLAVARRCHALLTQSYGVPEEDLYFDPLVFPCAAGDKGYYGSAAETIEGVRLIKREFPRSKTVLGISNVSFGLPPAGREVLNAVFLHHCVEAGLDLAIVNSEKLARYSALPEEERLLAERLLFWKGPGDPALPPGADPVGEFAARYRDAKPKAAASERAKLPAAERVARCVVEGSKEGLLEGLDELLKASKPLDIVNGPLMKGMDEVGRLFAANQMIVAEVLQSAEVMKAAVAHLEPHMDHASAAKRGKVLLATVKGDVHDIGKNLVHIILKNNGYEIADLGIKVEPQALIDAVRAHKPDLVGLSGLLVKSTQQMAATASDMKAAGLSVPMLVGGAALTARFTASRIAPAYGSPVLYAKDAMIGLALAHQLQDPARRGALLEENQRQQEGLAQASAAAQAPRSASAEPRGAAVSTVPPAADIPSPPDLKLHVHEDFDLERIFGYINPVMLYGKHLGLKGSLEELLEKNDPKALDLHAKVRALQSEALDKKLLKPRAVVKFFPAQGEGDSLILYDSAHEPRAAVETFTFPRQLSGERLCLADFVAPKSSGRVDYVALFVVTCGEGVRELSERLRESGDYLRSHALQALALESAEGFAELLHERLRSMWGIPDAVGMTLKEKFQARYRGIRVSFGYPACPAIEDQAKLFRLLEPEKRIGVRLTEGYMMDPEASVSALVLHHPEGRYFSVGPTA
ncbi:MAG TPA: methionine synthase [Elusimicrobia bacterium]|nr:methionine synthase [Elusimicrobiota bacterium]